MIEILLTKTLDIKWNNRYKKYYIELGYNFTKQGEIGTIDIEHLPETSTYKVKCSCDKCGKIFNTQYRYYSKSFKTNGKILCEKCQSKNNLNGLCKKENIKNVRNKFREKGLIPIFKDEEYINKRSYLSFICKNHPNIIQRKTYMNLLENKICCSMCHNGKVTNSECVNSQIASQWVENKNENFKIINIDDYVNEYTNLLLKCNVCGDIIENNINTLRNKKLLCKNCECIEKQSESKYMIDKIRNFVKSYNDNIFIPYQDYKNNIVDLKCICLKHNEVFYKPWSKLQNGHVQGCNKCLSESKRGENSPTWNPNLTDNEREKSRTNKNNSHVIWRNKIFERDKYTCQLSRVEGFSLVAHHLNGYHWCKKGRFDINNGITISREIHKLFHKLYGFKNNTKEQFIEFTKRYNIGEFDKILK